MKIKVNEKWGKILDWIFTLTFLAFAFWADWRIGAAFLAYDLSTVFSDVTTEIQVNKALKSVLHTYLEAHGGKDGAVKTPGGEN